MATPPAREHRDQADRVLASKALASSPVSRDLLRFLLEQETKGVARLTQKDLADALHRDPAETDRVRTAVSELRRRLREYATMEGAGDALEISIPHGSYVPRFQPRIDQGGAEAGVAPAPAPTPVAHVSEGRRTLRRGALVGAGLTVLAATLIVSLAPRLSRPHASADRVVVEGSRIAFLDSTGAVVASHDTAVADLEANWRHGRATARSLDVDGDGDAEWLFDQESRVNLALTGQLLCFGRDGTPRWQFRVSDVAPRRRPGGWDHSATYNIVRVEALAAPSPVLIVVATHVVEGPCLVVRLSADGEPTGTYVHEGVLGTFLADDVDGDGQVDVVAGGISNRHGHAPVLVVLDPSSLDGGSPGSPFVAGREKSYVLFPRLDSSVYGSQAPYATIRELRRLPDGHLAEVLHGPWEVFYELTLDAVVVKVIPSDGLRRALTEAITDPSAPGPQGLEDRLSALRYWTGDDWMNAPSRRYGATMTGAPAPEGR